MPISWSDLVAIMAIIEALVGFTFAGPGNVQNTAHAVLYVASVVFFILLFRRVRRGRPKEL